MTTLGNTNVGSGIFNISNNFACTMSISHTSDFVISTLNTICKGSTSGQTYYIKLGVWNSDYSIKHISTPIQVYYTGYGAGYIEVYSSNVSIFCLANTTYHIGYVAYASAGDIQQGYLTKITEYIYRVDESNSYSTPQTLDLTARYQIWPAIYAGVNDTVYVSKIYSIPIIKVSKAISIDRSDSFSISAPYLLIPVIPISYERGCFGGGTTGTIQDVIDYITITTTGNATDFGNLTAAREFLSACSNAVSGRGLFSGGANPATTSKNEVHYITIGTTGNASDFGDLVNGYRRLSSTSNGINERGIVGGGYLSTGGVNVIQYCTINSPGNFSDFGDLLGSTYGLAATSNTTNERGIFSGGFGTAGINVIQYITINSDGNASDFGDLSGTRRYHISTSNGTNERGLFLGGSNPTQNNTVYNIIEYVTINSAGNAADFGDLTVSRSLLGSTSNRENERGVIGGGYTGSVSDVIDYITINSAGNAADFGDLTVSRQGLAGCSN
jgi:hypothetical protein